jgi:wobble nucleotide-excising tRNase
VCSSDLRNKRQKIENGSTLSLLNLLEIKDINKAIEVSKCIIHDKPILYTEHIEEEYDKKKISRKITHLAKKCEIVKNAICKFNDVLQATIVISMNWHLPLTSFQENLEKLLRVKDESLITHLILVYGCTRDEAIEAIQYINMYLEDKISDPEIESD